MKKIYIYLLGIFVIVIGLISVLHFGNPQWNKYVYMWQAYVFPKYEFVANTKYSIKIFEHDQIPNDFTGVWRDYYPNGVLRQEHTVIKGMKFYETHFDFVLGKNNCDYAAFVGYSNFYYDNGELKYKLQKNTSGSKPEIVWELYDRQGKLLLQTLSKYTPDSQVRRSAPWPVTTPLYRLVNAEASSNYAIGGYMRTKEALEIFYDQHGNTVKLVVIDSQGKKIMIADQLKGVYESEKLSEYAKGLLIRNQRMLSRKFYLRLELEW